MDDKIGISGEPSWNEGFSLMSKGTGILMHKINESVHHFPYVYMMIIIAFTIVFSYWKVRKLIYWLFHIYSALRSVKIARF
jgi:hypothetical protein